MSCLSWNCRVLGQSRAVLELTELVKKILPFNYIPHGNQIKGLLLEKTLIKVPP